MRVTSSGRLVVELAPLDAIEFFTPEGERAWVPRWDPVYAASEPSEDAGTVFTTELGGVETIWVIIGIDRVSGTSTYARTTPRAHAGTVRVRCEATSPTSTTVHVNYDMTQLPGARLGAMDAYAVEPFSQMLAEWQTMIAAHVGRRS